MYWIVLMVPFSVSNEISMIELEVPLWTPLSLVGAARWNAIVVSLAGDMKQACNASSAHLIWFKNVKKTLSVLKTTSQQTCFVDSEFTQGKYSLAASLRIKVTFVTLSTAEFNAGTTDQLLMLRILSSALSFWTGGCATVIEKLHSMLDRSKKIYI